jgi:ribosome maturation factor RimP
MDRKAVIAKVEELARRVADRQGLEFVYAELAGTKNNLVVRVFLDKPGGITLDECGKASRDIEGAMDTIDLIPNSYVLEISSPGLDRRLFSRGDFEKFAGKTVKLKTDKEFGGRKTLKGELAGFEGDLVIVEDPEAGRLNIPLENILRANLVYDFSEEFGSRKHKDAG